MQVSLLVSAQNTWSDKFELLGDRHSPTSPARALISIVQGSVASTVTLRRYSGASVIQSLTMTAGQVLEVPVTGMYDIGAGKVTVFPGVASAAQIGEAKG